MNEKIKAHLVAYAETKRWATDDKTLFEILTESKTVFKETISSHRWYDVLFKVSVINGMEIGFNDYYMTGDNNASDMGLDPDYASVCEVVKKQKVTDYYEPINPSQP